MFNVFHIVVIHTPCPCVFSPSIHDLRDTEPKFCLFNTNTNTVKLEMFADINVCEFVILEVLHY